MTRRTPLLAVAVGLVLAACGTSEPAANSAPDAPSTASTDAPSAAVAPAETPTADPSVDEAPAATQAPGAEAPGSEAAPADPPATEPPATEPPATDAAPVEPEPPALGGRTFATVVEPDAQFEANPFPDLVVDDVGRGGEANIANILPSDRPVLLWTWAPH